MEFLTELGFFGSQGPITIFQDNTSAIRLASGTKCHKRSKHFGIEWDAFSEWAISELKIVYRQTSHLPADMLTKNLTGDKFLSFRDEVLGGEEEQNFFVRMERKIHACSGVQAEEKGRYKERSIIVDDDNEEGDITASDNG